MKFVPAVLLALIAFQSCLIVDGTFHEKRLDGVSLLMADNSVLMKDYPAWIDPETKTVHLDIPNYVDALALVPRVDFEGYMVLFDGEPWVDGRPVDLSRDRRLTVRARDDSEIEYAVEVNRVKRLDGVSILMANNSGLRKDYLAWIDHESRTVHLSIPDYVDALALVPRVEFEGYMVLFDGEPWVDGRPVDFSRNRRLTVGARDDSEIEYTVEVNRVTASSAKSLVSLYGMVIRDQSSSGGLDYRLMPFETRSSNTWVGYYYDSLIPPDEVYLRVVSTGIRVDIGGQVLVPGLQSWWPVIDANRWVTSKTSTLTVTAEDLSTTVVQLELEPSE